jgi:anti-anti-sigma factor
VTRDLPAFERKHGALWIVLPNSITMENSRDVENGIMAAAGPDAARVVVDLSGTGTLFSSGLGLLIRVRKQVCDRKGYICLVNVSRKIKSLLEEVHLDRIFDIFATDVEFEISQKDIVRNKLFGTNIGFVFAACRENGLYRINLSGYLTYDQDLSHLKGFVPEASVPGYVFDLAGLDLIDSTGFGIISRLLTDIKNAGGFSVAYGANDIIADLINLVSLQEMISLFPDERSALQSAALTKKE